jgi:TRAP-type mannitol/chloroaromatic compound transport system permease large subunit
MTAIIFVFLPNLYSVIEELQCAVAWFGVLIAMDLWTAYQPPPLTMSAECLKAVVP